MVWKVFRSFGLAWKGVKKTWKGIERSGKERNATELEKDIMYEEVPERPRS